MAELAGEQIVASAISIEGVDGSRILGFGQMPATSTVAVTAHPGEPGVLQFDVLVSAPFSQGRRGLETLPGFLRAVADMVEDQARRLLE